MLLSIKYLAMPLIFFVVLSMVSSVTPYADTAVQSTKSQSTKSQKPQFKPQQRGKPQLRRAGKNFKIKKGAEVAAKVRKLKESDRDVRAALKRFEDKKRMPKIDDSFAITGSLAPLKAQLNREGATLLKAGFSQDSALSGTDVELIFVTVLNLDLEWQGTVIANLYDSSGSLVSHYVADSVLVMPDYNLYAWDEIYEAPVYNGEVLPAINEPGMYTNVDVGIPLGQQQISTERNEANPLTLNRAVRVGYFQGGARIRAWANCTFGWCGGAGINCVGTDLWSADALNSSCFASGCGDYALGCAWEAIWQ